MLVHHQMLLPLPKIPLNNFRTTTVEQNLTKFYRLHAGIKDFKTGKNEGDPPTFSWFLQ